MNTVHEVIAALESLVDPKNASEQALSLSRGNGDSLYTPPSDKSVETIFPLFDNDGTRQKVLDIYYAILSIPNAWEQLRDMGYEPCTKNLGFDMVQISVVVGHWKVWLNATDEELAKKDKALDIITGDMQNIAISISKINYDLCKKQILRFCYPWNRPWDLVQWYRSVRYRKYHNFCVKTVAELSEQFEHKE